MPTSVSEALHRILLDQKLTVACAESITVGGVASHLGSCSGSSNYFKGGVVAYNIDAKVQLLGVDREKAARCDCVSEQTAFEMAVGVAKLFGADIGVATTGYAEPYPEQGVESPFAYIAVVQLRRDPEKIDSSRVERVVPPLSAVPVNWDTTALAATFRACHREEAQEKVAYRAIEMLVECLDPSVLEDADDDVSWP